MTIVPIRARRTRYLPYCYARFPDQVVIAFPLSHLAVNIIVVSSRAGKPLAAGNTHNAFSLDVQINGPAGTRTMRGFRSDRLRDWWTSTSTRVVHVITRVTAIIANVYQHSEKPCLTSSVVVSGGFVSLPRRGEGQYFLVHTQTFLFSYFSHFSQILIILVSRCKI